MGGYRNVCKLLFMLMCGSFCLLLKAKPATRVKEDWFEAGQQELRDSLSLKKNTNIAKNVIIFIGDGMGVSTITGARVIRQQMGLKDPRLSFEKFPYAGLAKTYDVDRIVADSSATATAILSGEKTVQGTAGVNQNAKAKNCLSTKGNELTTILNWSQDQGKAVGIVSTARVTHATPASAYAKTASRYWEYEVEDKVGDCKDIAYQLVHNNTNIQVVMGGGRTYLTPQTEKDVEYQDITGKRKDGLNLIQQWIKDKSDRKLQHKYVWNLTQFNAVNPDETDYLMGLFEPSHMQYELDRDKTAEPSLADMVDKSIKILKRNPKGFFLEVEAGRIDHAHHDSNAKRALTETLALSEAVQRAVDMVGDDTLMMVTADHSHTFTIGGYPTWNASLLGINDDSYSGKGLDGMRYTILGYANGPGYSINQTTGVRQDPVKIDTENDNYKQQSGVPLKKETHGGEEVAIFAKGPMSHLIHGSHEQNYLAHVMAYASCVGKNKNHCSKSLASVPQQAPITMFFLIALFISLFT